MRKHLKFFTFVLLLGSSFSQAQTFNNLFRTRDRADNLEDFDVQKFSWGFYLAGNNFDYKINLNPVYGMDGNRSLVTSKSTYSFGAGLIGKMRLNDFLDLRLEPGLHFVDRELTFDTQKNDPSLVLTDTDRIKKVKSTYLDVPIMLELHGDRWYNSRPYVAAGVNYLMNLQSNETSESDNQQNTFRTTSHNFGWSAEIGLQFYFSRFKLTPAIRGTFFTNNEIVADNANTPPYWTPAINTLQTRAIMFVLKFE